MGTIVCGVLYYFLLQRIWFSAFASWRCWPMHNLITGSFLEVFLAKCHHWHHFPKEALYCNSIQRKKARSLNGSLLSRNISHRLYQDFDTINHRVPSIHLLEKKRNEMISTINGNILKYFSMKAYRVQNQKERWCIPRVSSYIHSVPSTNRGSHFGFLLRSHLYDPKFSVRPLNIDQVFWFIGPQSSAIVKCTLKTERSNDLQCGANKT